MRTVLTVLFASLIASGFSTYAQTPAAPAQIGETLWLAREASVLADSTPTSAVARLPELLKKDFGIEVSCGKGQVFDPSAPRCLIGLRKLARAYYRGQLRAMAPALSEVLKINITDAGYPRLASTDTTVRVDLPYTMTTEADVAYVTRAVGTPVLAKRLADVALYKKTVAEWDELGMMELDFDPGLPLVDKQKALRNLIDLANEDQALFERPSEVLFISNFFRPTFERRLRLEEAIKGDATIDDVRRFLTEAKVENPSVTSTQARVDGWRERIRVAGEQLQQKLKVKYDCSDESWLTLRGCARTLEHLVRYTSRTGPYELDVKMILVVAQTDLTDDFDVFQSASDKEPYGILAVREGFNPRNLRILAEERGWVR